MAEPADTERDTSPRFNLWRTLVEQYELFKARRERGPFREVLLAMLLLAAFVILRCGWMCDDSFIVMRVVDNWIHGFGLRWNAAERVQVYTCPLWVFLLTPFVAVSREYYFTVVFVSLGISFAALWLIVNRVLGGTVWGIAFIAVFVFSKTLVDFSTSGLEVPLSYLLLVGFLLSLIHFEKSKSGPDHRAVLLCFGVAALAMTTRLDNLWLVAPGLLYVFFSGPFSRRRIGLALLGMSPIILWELFSLFYYGSLVPNTAYAKLSTGIPSGQYWEQGLFYLRTLLAADPLASFAMILGVGVGLASRRKSPAAFWLAVGVALHIFYVVRVGGDHMLGRFLAPGALVSLIILYFPKVLSYRGRMGATAVLVVLGFASDAPPLFTRGDQMNRKIDAGVADERGFFSSELSFMVQARNHRLVNTPWARKGREHRRQGKHSLVWDMVGCFGLFAGPEVHIIDPLGLTDPLISRLPSNPKYWRTGHYWRKVPKGYEGATMGKAKLANSSLRSLYNRIQLITRGDLLDLERLLTIWEMNTGAFDHFIDAYRRSFDRGINYVDTALFRSHTGALWNDPEHRNLSYAGIVVLTPKGKNPDLAKRPRRLEVSLRGGHSYELELWLGNQMTGKLSLNLEAEPGEKMTVRNLAIPPKPRQKGFDRIFIVTNRSDQLATLGHLRLSPFEVRMKAAAFKPKPTPKGQEAQSAGKGQKPQPAGPAFWFGGQRLVVELERRRFAPTISISLSGDDTYQYEVRRAGKTVFKAVSPKTGDDQATANRVLNIPPKVASGGYDELVLDPVTGNAPSAVQHIFL